MVVALMLSLPVEMVFGDPNIHHRYLGPILPHSTCNFFRLDTLGATYLRNDFIYLVSGTVDWFLSLRLHLRDLSNVLWFAEQPLRGRSSRSMLRGLSKAESVCSEFGLTPVRFVHHMYGGATNAVHLVGFSQVFGFESAPFPHPLSVSRSIRHHWKSAVPLRHPIRVCSRLPAVVGDHKRPLIVNNMLRVEGLLPVDSPYKLVCGPSVFYPSDLIQRTLSREELLAIYDVPLGLVDALLEHAVWSQATPLPFESSISPVIATNIFRTLWSNTGGVLVDWESKALSSSSPAGDPKETEVVEEFNESEGDSKFFLTDSKSVVTNDNSGATPQLVEESVGSSSGSVCSLSTASDSMLPPLMDRADDSTCSSINLPPLLDQEDDSTCPSIDISLSTASLSQIPELDARHDDDSSDEGTLSVPTLIRRSDSSSSISDRSFDTSSAGDSFMPRKGRGTAKQKLEFVGDWEYLDDVSIAATATETDEASLASKSYLPEEPGSELSSTVSLSDTSTIGSSTSAASAATIKATASPDILKDIEDAAIGKKAVRADDAEVPVHLWNSRIPESDRVKDGHQALNGFRSFGLQLFRRALYLDCMEYLDTEYGSDWRSKLESGQLKLKSSSGKLTELGRELDAVRGILWHANETNWFEYLSGSRLHHFRFPIRYRKEARDGTEIFFEKKNLAQQPRQGSRISNQRL